MQTLPFGAPSSHLAAMSLRPCLAAAAALLVVACGKPSTAPAPAAAAPAKVDPKEIVTEPAWTRRPTREELEALRPAKAANLKVSAVANLWCVAQADGTLARCQVDWQDPPNLGFGDAALKAAPLYRIAPTDKLGLVEGRPVEVRFSWPANGEA